MNFLLGLNSLINAQGKSVTKLIEYIETLKKNERKKITKKTKSYREEEDRVLLHNLLKMYSPSPMVL